MPRTRTYKRAPTQPDGTGIIERKEDRTELVNEEYEIEELEEELDTLLQARSQTDDRITEIRAHLRAIRNLA